MPKSKTNTKSKADRFDAAQAITNEVIALIERGTVPWRQPWIGGGAAPAPLRQCGEAYQGVNNFLLSMRGLLAGYSSPYWMTYLQAKKLGAQVRKGEKGSIVVHYGTSIKKDDTAADETVSKDNAGQDNEPTARGGRIIAHMKHYRVFNADQIDGLDDVYFPRSEPRSVHLCDQAASKQVPHLHAFFENIGTNTVFSGREAKYVPTLDKIYMPEFSLFESAEAFYSTWGHECAHWTKRQDRLNRDYGDARFGNTSYSREEITAELASVFLGQHLGYAQHRIEMSASYINHWVRVLKSDARAIFKQAADAQTACNYLIECSAKGKTRAEVRQAQLQEQDEPYEDLPKAA